jgi:outer membrane lipoprotein-sorting protein
MKRLLLACAAAAALVAAASVYAQTVVPRHVFVAVDAFEIRATTVKVTGVLDGESAAKTITVSFYVGSSSGTVDQVTACERLALLAMTRPGQFRFEIEGSAGGGYTVAACKLARVMP